MQNLKIMTVFFGNFEVDIRGFNSIFWLKYLNKVRIISHLSESNPSKNETKKGVIATYPVSRQKCVRRTYFTTLLACPGPSTEGRVLDSHFLLQIDTFGFSLSPHFSGQRPVK